MNKTFLTILSLPVIILGMIYELIVRAFIAGRLLAKVYL